MVHRSNHLRPEFLLPLTLIALITGCGGGSTSAPPASRVRVVCTEAAEELQTIDRHSLRAAGPRLEGALIEHAATESLKVDASTSLRLRDLPASRQRSAALSNITRSESQLRAVLQTAKDSPGIAFGDLPGGTVLRFLKSNVGCGITALRRLIIR
jgi:hypothetical protein